MPWRKNKKWISAPQKYIGISFEALEFCLKRIGWPRWWYSPSYSPVSLHLGERSSCHGKSTHLELPCSEGAQEGEFSKSNPRVWVKYMLYICCYLQYHLIATHAYYMYMSIMWSNACMCIFVNKCRYYIHLISLCLYYIYIYIIYFYILIVKLYGFIRYISNSPLGISPPNLWPPYQDSVPHVGLRGHSNSPRLLPRTDGPNKIAHQLWQQSGPKNNKQGYNST